VKTLLFNGCSFVAGDDLGWDYSVGKPWNNIDLWNQHVEKRKTWNLAARCATELETTAIDLSQDGNSNTSIAITTINYILKLSEEEKSNLHVCVGWTEPTRFFHWVSKSKKFHNIILSNFINDQSSWTNSPHATMIRQEMKDYCLAKIAGESDTDVLLRYISEISWLESFLKANHISYTFWRSMGTVEHQLDNIGSVIAVDTISDASKWIVFNVDTKLPWIDESWYIHIRKNNESFSLNNHPSDGSVNNQAIRICNYVRMFNQLN
jgi:hypothetical protein